MHKMLVLVTFLALPALAATPTKSPYAGEETREIKSLSPQQIDDYLNGRGMGFAKVAELNHFPGPRHVLDLAGALALSEEQIRQTNELFEAMQTQAVAYGQALVEKEKTLDAAFADHSIDETRLESILKEIAGLQGQLRQTHLVAHIRQKALLSQDQLIRYDRLRGYRHGQTQEHQHSH